MDNNLMYLNSDFWSDALGSQDIHDKVPLILNWIPPQVRTIIDIGCGNGIITNALAKSYDVTGVDASAEALEFVQGKKIHASADKIPVSDHTFDMAFSSEMLEHIPDASFQMAVNEIKRIARRYVFITVPNQEQLANLHVKCPQCGKLFHKYGHLQSIGLARLNSLMGNEYRLLRTGTFGPLIRDYLPVLLNIKNRVAKVWSTPEKHNVCPYCGNTQFGKKRKTVLSHLCNELNNAITKKRPYWLFALYERTTQDGIQ